MSEPSNSYCELDSDRSFIPSDRRHLTNHFVHFMDETEQYGFINLEPWIIGKLRITSEDAFVEEIVPDGILLRRATSAKEH